MSNLYTNYGMDFDLVFKSGSGKQNFYIFDDTGLDIGQKFVAGSSYLNTGFLVADGTDIRTKLLSEGTSYAIVRRTSGGWDAAESTGRGFDMSYQARRHDVLLGMWKDTSKFAVVGPSDHVHDETGYYMNASKFYRVDQKPGAPQITSIRVAVNRLGWNSKADIAAFYVEQQQTGIFTFVLGYYRRSHGWVSADVQIFGQTAYGEVLLYTCRYDQP